LLKHTLRKSARTARTGLSRTRQLLLKDEAFSGKLLLIAALTAIALVNSPWGSVFSTFWDKDLSLSLGSFVLEANVRQWINDGLMAIFFLVISLEIKRELVRGELRKMRAAVLPVFAALGGIAVPIAIYMLLNNGFSGEKGWGIPMTTDTAFALGLLALLGRRVPTTLKIFLLTTMVIDDVAASSAIAVFYNHTIQVPPLIIAGAVYILILGLHWLRQLHMRGFIILGIVLWICFYLSGVHASIAGVILGLAAPISIRHSKHHLSIAERLEKSLIPVSTFIIVPLFALANAGVVLSWDNFSQEAALRAGGGIFLGLVVGKVIGITVAVWLAKTLRIARLPKGLSMHHIIGVALLAGVGFTLSIFIAELAFAGNRLFIDAAKMSIFAASLCSAVAGLIYLSVIAKPLRKARQRRAKTS
jgi:NhaA family Na+:H+ antiporter